MFFNLSLWQPNAPETFKKLEKIKRKKNAQKNIELLFTFLTIDFFFVATEENVGVQLKMKNFLFLFFFDIFFCYIWKEDEVEAENNFRKKDFLVLKENIFFFVFVI